MAFPKNPFARNFFYFSASILCIAATWTLVSSAGKNDSTSEQAIRESYQRYFNNHYKVFSLNLPAEATFAGERVPLEKIDVRERFDRELLVNTYWQSQTLLFHKRANRWFPTIEAILAEEGVPDDFKYLALIESGLANVVSPAGATGYWQILKETGKELGLEINSEVDERYHVEKSTRAACIYFKQAYAKFGSWTSAAASYNMGMHGLQKQKNRQLVGDYYDLLLVDETSRYVFRILAAKEIISKPAQFGFHFRPSDLYPAYEVREIGVDRGIKDLASFAQENGTNYKVLKILNPWLRENYLANPYQKNYAIKLPANEDFGVALTETLEEIEATDRPTELKLVE